mmetsp:Transcript_43275/g.41659  ORF Transcript_43275/g.41659 Transcript_43275/m.41659 type:complete len:125 (-) Transcript_43275:846-1220(-)
MEKAVENMKELFEEERKAYNEERQKFGEEEEKLKKIQEAKIKIFKNKLVTLYDGNVELAKDLSIDELFEHIAFRLNHGDQRLRRPPSLSSINTKSNKETSLERKREFDYLQERRGISCRGQPSH